MRGKSCLIERRQKRHRTGEVWAGVMETAALAAAGLVLMLLPALQNRSGAVLAEGWLLLLITALCAGRPLVFSRGFPDLVSGLIRALYYMAAAWAVNGETLSGPARYRLLLGLLLGFVGLSKFVLFARLYDSVSLPFLPVSALCDIAGAVLLPAGLPALFLYWLLGMLMLADAGEHLAETRLVARLRARGGENNRALP